jgi:cytochrome c556
MKRTVRFGLAAATAAISVIALAQTATPAKSAAEAKTVIEARQKVFEDMKKAYEPMTDMLKRKREFDAALVATNSAQIQALAQKIPAHLAVDTHTFKDIKTVARDNIWTNLPDIKAKSDALVTAAGNVAKVAAGGDKATTMKAIPEIGKSCGSCHDDYKDDAA